MRDERLLSILVVDDDEDDYALVKSYFQEISTGEYHLEWVDSYDAALNMLERKYHDVYLVDYNLGKGDGIQLLGEMIRRGCSAPIIFLTGYKDYEIDLAAIAYVYMLWLSLLV